MTDFRHITYFSFLISIRAYTILRYWVGQNICSGFSARCYGKTWVNFSGQLNTWKIHSIHLCSGSQKTGIKNKKCRALSYWKEFKDILLMSNFKNVFIYKTNIPLKLLRGKFTWMMKTESTLRAFHEVTNYSYKWI